MYNSSRRWLLCVVFWWTTHYWEANQNNKLHFTGVWFSPPTKMHYLCSFIDDLKCKQFFTSCLTTSASESGALLKKVAYHKTDLKIYLALHLLLWNDI